MKQGLNFGILFFSSHEKNYWIDKSDSKVYTQLEFWISALKNVDKIYCKLIKKNENNSFMNYE